MVKNKLLVVCLPLCGALGCVGGRSDVDGGRDRPRTDTDGGGGSQVSSGRSPSREGGAERDATPGSDTSSSNDITTEPDLAVLSEDGGVAVGDRFEGDIVVNVWHYGDCTTIELQGTSAPFECSETQLAALGAATSDAIEPAPADGSAALGVTTCDDLAELQRPLLRQTLSDRLRRNYLEQLAEYCLVPTREIYVFGGQQVDRCPVYAVDAGVVDEGPDPGEEAAEYSTTNTQVVGVDEADYVKNDGDTIYVLNEQSLVVFDAWPVEDLVEIGRVDLPAEPRRMFLAEDRLIVYLRVGGQARDTCTYGYDCRSSSESGSTLVHVYDVTEPALPTLLKEYEFSGSYLTSRRIGDAVLSVVHDPAVLLPEADTRVDAVNPEQLEEQYTSKSANLAQLVESLPAEYFLPSIIERAPGEPDTTTAACNAALATSASRGTSFVSIVGFDLATLGAPSSTLIASKPGFVYASAQSLYLAVDGVDGGDAGFSSPWEPHGDVEADRSTIHKFALDGIVSTYHGSQAIPGHVLNQFSMDEHENVLRVATTNGWVPDNGVSSNIVTLGEQEQEFAVLGQLRGLAPNEDIRSVRFDGERGFVVTFKEIDPLFAIGLSEPAAPVILGELKIPGFSTYLHMLDESHLLAVGFEADDQGDFAFFDGIQVQIFDISDLSDPKLQHKAVIGTRGSGSEALLDHLAFNYFPSRNLLALPATICGSGDDDVYGNEFEFAGLVVFDVSLENGLTERGRLPFATPADVDAGQSRDCAVWWTDATSLVKRSIFMEDYAIGLSDEWLKVAALSDLGTVLSSVPLSE